LIKFSDKLQTALEIGNGFGKFDKIFFGQNYSNLFENWKLLWKLIKAADKLIQTGLEIDPFSKLRST
jgi:hypothetical protein